MTPAARLTRCAKLSALAHETYFSPAVNIMLMRQAPLVGRAVGLLEGQGASEGEEREKEEEDDER